MYQIMDYLNKVAYNELVDYLIEHSDSFIFHLPNMGKILANERNVDLMSEYPIGYSEEFEQERHKEYVKRMEPYIEVIKDDIIERHYDTGYLDQASNREIEVFNVRISPATKQFFQFTEGFERWTYPELPENPCFLREGKCIFQSIVHEDLYFVYLDDENIEKILKRNHISYMYMPDEEVLIYS